MVPMLVVMMVTDPMEVAGRLDDRPPDSWRTMMPGRGGASDDGDRDQQGKGDDELEHCSGSLGYGRQKSHGSMSPYWSRTLMTDGGIGFLSGASPTFSSFLLRCSSVTLCFSSRRFW